MNWDSGNLPVEEKRKQESRKARKMVKLLSLVMDLLLYFDDKDSILCPPHLFNAR